MKHAISITAFTLLSLFNLSLQSVNQGSKKITSYFSKSCETPKQRKSALDKLTQAALAVKAARREQNYKNQCAKAVQATSSRFSIKYK